MSIEKGDGPPPEKKIIAEEREPRSGCVASIRQEKVDLIEHSVEYKVGTDMGISFYTDSSTLAQNVASTEGVGIQKDSSDLVYVTKRTNEAPVSRMPIKM